MVGIYKADQYSAVNQWLPEVGVCCSAGLGRSLTLFEVPAALSEQNHGKIEFPMLLVPSPNVELNM